MLLFKMTKKAQNSNLIIDRKKRKKIKIKIEIVNINIEPKKEDPFIINLNQIYKLDINIF
jgi:hypothetical protein